MMDLVPAAEPHDHSAATYTASDVAATGAVVAGVTRPEHAA